MPDPAQEIKIYTGREFFVVRMLAALLMVGLAAYFVYQGKIVLTVPVALVCGINLVFGILVRGDFVSISGSIVTRRSFSKTKQLDVQNLESVGYAGPQMGIMLKSRFGERINIPTRMNKKNLVNIIMALKPYIMQDGVQCDEGIEQFINKYTSPNKPGVNIS